MEQTISWIATAATIAAASITASNLGSRITGYGFIVFTFGSISWFAFGLMSGQQALVWTNAVLTFLNLFGVWRWLGRQAKVEEGAKAAAAASLEMPGESLFRASLLTSAKVRCGDQHVGTCVDAMARCRSGRLDYVVVSQGGVAGVGETLRRVSWSDAHIEGDELVARLEPARFDELETVSREEWPAR